MTGGQKSIPKWPLPIPPLFVWLLIVVVVLVMLAMISLHR